MDDIICCCPCQFKLQAALAFLKDQLKTIGLSISVNKPTTIFTPNPREPLVYLGNLIAGDHLQWSSERWQKVLKFFDRLDETALHPHVAFVLLKLCGINKITYTCQNNLPSFTVPLATAVQQRLLRSLGKLLGHDVSIEDVMGPHRLAMHDFVKEVPKLFEECQRVVALLINGIPPESQLTARNLAGHESVATSGALFNPSPLALCRTGFKNDAWFFFKGSAEALSPSDFIDAVNLRIAPLRIVPTNCNCICGKILRDADDAFTHIMACARSSKHTKLHRHDDVKYAILRHLSRFGIYATDEPRFYEYADGSFCRPDIVVQGSPVICTDVTFVTPSELLGSAAEAAAQKKYEKHLAAVSKKGHVFIPFACEDGGLIGEDAVRFTELVAAAVPDWIRSLFKKQLYHAVSTAFVASCLKTLRKFNQHSVLLTQGLPLAA
jgi:hypothetical protein